MNLTFIVGGREVEAADLIALAPKKKAKAPSDRGGFHKGFRVEGYPPGAIDAAEAEAVAAREAWLSMSTAERRGLSEPPVWDLTRWAAKHKRKPVARPYSLPQAADECATLAEKAGWTHVQIVALQST